MSQETNDGKRVNGTSGVIEKSEIISEVFVIC